MDDVDIGVFEWMMLTLVCLSGLMFVTTQGPSGVDPTRGDVNSKDYSQRLSTWLYMITSLYE